MKKMVGWWVRVLFLFSISTIAETLDISRLDSTRFRLGWKSHPGRSYFLQYSYDLRNWTTLKYYHYGLGKPVDVASDCPGPNGTPVATNCFWRLKYADVSTVNPDKEDFDGDKISNAAELQQGTDPLAFVDEDADQLPDDWELYFYNSTETADRSTPNNGGSGGSVGDSYRDGTSPGNGGAIQAVQPFPELSTKIGMVNVSNSAFRQYAHSANPRRFRTEKIDYESDYFGTITNGPWHSQTASSGGTLQITRVVNPLTGTISESGTSSRYLNERTDYDSTGNDFRLYFENSLAHLGSDGWNGNFSQERWNRTVLEYSIVGSISYAPILFDYSIPLLSTTATQKTYYLPITGGSRSGTNKLSDEYTTQQFLSDATQQALNWESEFLDNQYRNKNLMRRYISNNSAAVFYKNSFYKWKTPGFLQAALIDWYEIFLPLNDPSTSINEENEYITFTRRIWNKGPSNTESGEYYLDARQKARDGDTTVLFTHLVSGSAINNGFYDMTKNNELFYNSPGWVSRFNEARALENSLVLRFEDCADANAILARNDVGFDLRLGGNLYDSFWWELEKKPPGAADLVDLGEDYGDDSLTVKRVDNQGGALKGGLYRYKLKRDSISGTGTFATPIIAQVWLPLAAPDIQVPWQNEIDYFVNSWGPAYRAELERRVSHLSEGVLKEAIRNQTRMEDFFAISPLLKWTGGPLGSYAPIGGPEEVVGVERRYTLHGVVIDAQKRNNMMYALIGRLMGLSEAYLLAKAVGTANPASFGNFATPASLLSYQAGFHLFNGLALSVVMRTLGRGMQEPGTWARWEWPSEEMAVSGPELSPIALEDIWYFAGGMPEN